jgi:uncharacterized membrane protein
MAAFFYFGQAMRFANHVCILVNVNITDEEAAELDKKALIAYEKLNADLVGEMLNRGAYFNTAGFRMYYLSFPVIAWIGGGYYMIAATFILLAVLRTMDFNTMPSGSKKKTDSLSNIIEMSES